MNHLVNIVDYGINNIQSVVQAFHFIGVDTKIATKPSDLIDADHIVIPGVGAFSEGMKKLKNLKLDKMILKKAEQKSNILGICLGMQMLFTKGYEYGEHDGLNLVSGKVLEIKKTTNYVDRLPIIGWRKTIASHLNKENLLTKSLNKKSFYYLHSYQVIPEKKDDIFAYYEVTDNININAAINKNNIWGVQFHPEKSGSSGLEFLKNFSNLNINKKT